MYISFPLLFSPEKQGPQCENNDHLPQPSLDTPNQHCRCQQQRQPGNAASPAEWTTGDADNCKESVCLPHSFSLLLSTVHTFIMIYVFQVLQAASFVTVMVMLSSYMRSTHVVTLLFYFNHQICTLQTSNVFTKLPLEINLRY